MTLISTNPNISSKKSSKLPSRDKNLKESLHKVTKEWQLLQDRRTERMNQMIERTRKQEEILRSEEKNEQERMKQEKLQRLAEKIDSIQARMKDREIQLPKEKEELKALLMKTPKVVKEMMEAREHDEKAEKERIEEKLALIKEKYKPMTKEQLEAHAKMHDEIMEKIHKDKEIEKASKMKETFKPSFKSALHEIIEIQEKTLKNHNKLEEMQKRHETLQKLKEFQKKVKAEFLPDIDPRKKQSLKEKIFKLNHPAFKFFVPKDLKNKAFTEEDLDQFAAAEKSPQTIGKSYLQYAKLHKKTHPNARSLEKLPYHEPEEKNEKNSVKSSKYENYLRKVPLPRKDEVGYILNNSELNLMEKKEKVFAKAEAWEDEAERKEKLMKVKGGYELNVEADELRVKAMKAKLALLRNGSLE